MDDSLSSSNPDSYANAESQSFEEIPVESVISEENLSEGLDDSPPQEEAILRRAAVELAERKAELRALATLSSARVDAQDSLESITSSLTDPSATVRATAVRTLYAHNPDLATSLLNQTIRESSLEDRKRIGTALLDSGLIDVRSATAEDARSFYSARSLLFLLAKAGEAAALVNVIRDHPDLNLRIALIKSLASSQAPEVSPALQQLLTDPSLPKEARSAAMEAILQLVGDE